MSHKHRSIFSNTVQNPEEKEIHKNNISIKSNNDHTHESLFQQIINFFSHINLCLRPELQSHQLTTFLEQYEVVSLYQDPYYGECYAL